ncbi:uncharacterized protein LOC132740406 [Ruditapes philippinarum]|uniref:uncharacterized protein LOC132740406 n=1 Tax=Ruditapes philippinarum TaxID=129788 RepID=UPI00295AE30B|nr:uncharacterized protein LOC132740406 [Ruditapes philippinarum]
MCDSLDRHSKDGTLGNTWKKRFRNKWPTMTTLMHQSEITIRPYLEHEYADPHEIMAYQNCRIPDWDGSSETSWSAAKSLEQDMHDEDTLPKINQISHVVKKRRCDKVCRHVLCGFLILSIVMAVAAAIGLSFFLNLHQNDGFATQDDEHHHGKYFIT